jgi:hypothetical protein
MITFLKRDQIISKGQFLMKNEVFDRAQEATYLVVGIIAKEM